MAIQARSGRRAHRTARTMRSHPLSLFDDLLAMLIVVAGTVGSPRDVSAAPRIALAAGHDVGAVLDASDTFGR